MIMKSVVQYSQDTERNGYRDEGPAQMSGLLINVAWSNSDDRSNSLQLHESIERRHPICVSACEKIFDCTRRRYIFKKSYNLSDLNVVLLCNPRNRSIITTFIHSINLMLPQQYLVKSKHSAHSWWSGDVISHPLKAVFTCDLDAPIWMLEDR